MNITEKLYHFFENESRDEPSFDHYWTGLQEEEKKTFIHSIINKLNEEHQKENQFDLAYFEKTSHHLANELEMLLSSFCKQSVSVHVLNVQRLSFKDHMDTSKTKETAFTLLNIFQENSHEFGRICLEMDRVWVDFIYEHLLGGNPTSLKVKSDVFNETKRIILEEWINSYVETMLNETIFLNSTFAIQTYKIETNPSYVKLVKPNDSIISISFSASVGETTANFHLLLPEITLHMINSHSEEVQ